MLEILEQNDATIFGRDEKYFKDTIKEDRSVALWRPYGDFLCEAGVSGV